MRRDSVNSASGIKTALTIVFSDHDFLIKGLKLWRFDNTISEFWAYFHRAFAKTAIYELPVKNLTPPFAPATSIYYMRNAFSLPSDVYGIYSTFLCYYVAWPCDLDLWSFDLESVSCTVLLMSVHIPIFIILWLSVTELRVLNIWSHFRIFRYMKQSLRVRRVTWPLSGGKNSQHFWNPWPLTFTALWQRLSHVIGEK